MKFSKLITIGLLTFALASVGRTDSVPKNADIFCDKLFQLNPTLTEKEYLDFFDPVLVSKISYASIIKTFAQFQPEFGNCTKFKSTSQSEPSKYNLTLTTQSGLEAFLMLSVNQTNGLFNGLRFSSTNNPAVTISSWDDVAVATKNLDNSSTGFIGASLKTANNKVRLSISDGGVFAIGSTFKLYVLGALYSSIAKGQHAWSEKLAIRDEWKSLPSGIMQTFPVGQEFSLLDFASYMISISDNTAADHLLNFLGKNAVEGIIKPMGNAHAALDTPLMSTLEMFKLKWAVDPKDTATYLGSDAGARRVILADLAKFSRDSVGKNGVSMTMPTDIANLEWFGSTDDTCNAILWLGNQSSAEVRQVLSKSTPMVDPDNKHWSFVGFKGGSEPGVLSATYLLEAKNGNRGCLSMSWNNTAVPVQQFHFFDVVRKTLTFAESQIP